MRHGRYRRRPYRGPGDLRAMQSLTRRLWGGASRWHIGELVWFRYQHPGRATQWRTALWEEGTEVAAWAWAKQPGLLDLHLDPARPGLADQVLEWFEDLALGPERTVTVLDSETGLIEALRRRGYREEDGSAFFVHMRRDLADLPEPRVPEGYTLRRVCGEDDAAARARVHRAAFTLAGRPPPAIGAEDYRRIMRSWPYRAELDWLVEAPDGGPAAFCLVWLDEHHRVAALEPVGTAPGHRRRGLAGAAALAALRTARDLGARTARVCARGDSGAPAARAAYASLGFTPFARNVSFVRGREPVRVPGTPYPPSPAS